ncbi:hypothetical protein XFF6992_240060 [Xanthomonas citri pv. fuscans]|nr:hypothetical protein XFF6992_240060 [Xanthomonas citri pv. fuscans]SOO34434.1 hypothetical protein XFF6994_4030003 [Xanthomonas citri pv. fuscans]
MCARARDDGERSERAYPHPIPSPAGERLTLDGLILQPAVAPARCTHPVSGDLPVVLVFASGLCGITENDRRAPLQLNA